MTDPSARDLNAPTTLVHPSPGNVRNQVAETVNMDDVAGDMTIGAPLRSDRGQTHGIADGAAERAGCNSARHVRGDWGEDVATMESAADIWQPELGLIQLKDCRSGLIQGKREQSVVWTYVASLAVS